MPKFKPNTSKAVGKGPYKMKYKHSAFPFKSSPAKFFPIPSMGVARKANDTGAIVPPHTHDGGGEATESGTAATSSTMGPSIGTSGGAATSSGVIPTVATALRGFGRRTVPGQV